MALAEIRDEIKRFGTEPRRALSARSGDTPRESVQQTLQDEERLQRMESEGLMRRGSGAIPTHFWSMPRPSDPEGSVMQALLDERESSRF